MSELETNPEFQIWKKFRNERGTIRGYDVTEEAGFALWLETMKLHAAKLRRGVWTLADHQSYIFDQCDFLRLLEDRCPECLGVAAPEPGKEVCSKCFGSGQSGELPFSVAERVEFEKI